MARGPDEVFNFDEVDRRVAEAYKAFPYWKWLGVDVIDVEARDVTPDHARPALNPGANEGIPNQSLGDSGSLDA